MADFNCVIVGAGAQSDGSVAVCLTDTAASPAFNQVWFRAIPAAQASILATALTGVSAGLDGGCTLEGTTPGSQLSRLVVLAP